MSLAVEVALVHGSMINQGYRERGLYTQKYWNRELTFPAKTDLDSDQSLLNLIRETQRYVKAEKIKLKKLLGR